MSTAVQVPALLTRPEAAEYLRLKTQTLAAMACHGRGPRFVRCGRSVRYRLADLDGWMEQNTVVPAGEAMQD